VGAGKGHSINGGADQARIGSDPCQCRPHYREGAVRRLLVAPFVVTVRFLAVRGAPGVMVKFAVTVVSFTTVTPLAVILPAPDTFTAVVPVRLVPVRVTGTTVPRAPVLERLKPTSPPAP